MYGVDYFLKNVKSIFETDDFTIVNFEGTLTESENIRATKEWNHKGRPEYVNILKNASVEAVTLGNNHIMDYEIEGKVIPCMLSSTTKRNDFCPIVVEGDATQKIIEQLNGYSEEFETVIDENGKIVK